MKTIHLFALCACVSLSTTVSASIITVNNGSPSPGQHTTIPDAITAATAGDTLMVAGTDLTYGNFTIDKSITLLGPGWTVSGGGISRVAICGAITISAHNVRVEGLRFSSMTMSIGSVTQIDNLAVKRCVIDNFISATSEHIMTATIEGNVFTMYNDYNLTSSTSSWAFGGCTIRNNIFNGFLYNVDNSVIEHNIFMGTGAVINITSNITQGNVFQGNIAIGRNLASVYAGNTVSGNLGYNSAGTVWISAGNINEANPNFVAYTNLAVHNWTNDYHLSGGSPAIGAGPSGDDIGVYDGDGVYRQDGEPSIPIVRSVNVPGGAVVPANATFNVNIISVAHE